MNRLVRLRTACVGGLPGRRALFLRLTEVAAKKVRQKAHILTALSIHFQHMEQFMRQSPVSALDSANSRLGSVWQTLALERSTLTGRKLDE